jgi:hypothetical protein
MDIFELIRKKLGLGEETKRPRGAEDPARAKRIAELLQPFAPPNDGRLAEEHAFLAWFLQRNPHAVNWGDVETVNAYPAQEKLAEAALERLEDWERRMTEIRQIAEDWYSESEPLHNLGAPLRVLVSQTLEHGGDLPDALYLRWLRWVQGTHVRVPDQYNDMSQPWKKRFERFEKAVQRSGVGPEPMEMLRTLCRRFLDAPFFVRHERAWLFPARTRIGMPADLCLSNTEHPWASQAVQEIRAMAREPQAAWARLMEMLAGVDGAEPSQKWLAAAQQQLAEPALGEWQTTLRGWVKAFVETKPENPLQNQVNAAALKGIGWLCALADDRELVAMMAGAAKRAYDYVSSNAALASSVGNAFIVALGLRGDAAALEQLALLKAGLKRSQAQKAIEKALQIAAKKSDVSKDAIVEAHVPDYGLTDVGVLERTVGEWTVRLCAEGSRKLKAQWRRADGTEAKSLPAAFKKEHGRDLAALKKTQAEVEKMLSAQAQRLESIFMQPRSWPLEVWRKHYLDHPLVGVLARKLIWRFSERAGGWHEGRMLDVNGDELALGAETTVQLWHPLDAPAGEVLAWRQRLEACAGVQPFKQAHREIYLLTPAEERTATYSNRFAAHVLDQNRLHALAIARGWRHLLSTPHGEGGGQGPQRDLPDAGLRAEFWTEPAMDDMTDNDTYLYVSTDQVRFRRLRGRKAEADPLPVTEVPRHVWSEVLRDVDLFVAVAGIANDPNWFDGRSDSDRTVWERQAFGDLSATAETRRELLEHLLPRLKIAAVCSLEGRFLVVRGKLRTYKIHLGSANILMSPNDQYLCIVGDRKQAPPSSEFLPFEGDAILSLILSKAFLLAADDRISDASMLRQIQP